MCSSDLSSWRKEKVEELGLRNLGFGELEEFLGRLGVWGLRILRGGGGGGVEGS